jgi:glutaredoxin
MRTKRKVEIFSAGCPLCCDAVELVRRIGCPSCEVQVLDMKAPAVAARAKERGIRFVPAVLVDGRLSDCCAGRGPGEETLRNAGVGTPIP